MGIAYTRVTQNVRAVKTFEKFWQTPQKIFQSDNFIEVSKADFDGHFR